MTLLRTRWGRWLRGLAAAASAVIILFSGFVGYGLIGNRWYQIVAIVGGSMAPAIRPGDAIVITRPPSRLAAGMIVTMQVGRSVVTHRIAEVKADGSFITKGDSNATVDDWGAHKVRIVGIHRFRIPGLGSTLLSITKMRQVVTSSLASIGVGR